MENAVAKRAYPLAKVYGLLEPGPVVLVATQRRGRANVMPMSWYTMMEFEPPLLGCVLSGRNFSFEALTATRQCTINIPTADLAKQVVGCGNVSGRRVDKWQRFGLTPVPGKVVAAPRVEECFANLECVVVDRRLVNRYNFFVLEVKKAWVDTACKSPRTLHHRGWGTFAIAGETLIKLRSGKK